MDATHNSYISDAAQTTAQQQTHPNGNIIYFISANRLMWHLL
jgi:hypothetical protein